MDVPAEIEEEELRQKALGEDKMQSFLEGKTVERVIIVPRRLVNVVVRP